VSTTPQDHEHPAQEACEDVAEDLSEAWSEAERLRKLVESKLARVGEAGEAGAMKLASKLTALRDSLAKTLARVDERTDEVAGRFPRRAPEKREGPANHGWK
jgi:hypothetical protein